jgi:hypothetical protein
LVARDGGGCRDDLKVAETQPAWLELADQFAPRTTFHGVSTPSLSGAEKFWDRN